jgi:hypothetical protein
MSHLGPVTRALLLPWRTKGRAADLIAATVPAAGSVPARTATLAPATPRMSVAAFLNQRLESAAPAARNKDMIAAAEMQLCRQLLHSYPDERAAMGALYAAYREQPNEQYRRAARNLWVGWQLANGMAVRETFE